MFADFYTLWWVALILPIIILGGKIIIRSKAITQKLSILKNNSKSDISVKWLIAKLTFIVFGVLLLILALWRPQWGQEIQKTHKNGLDIVFAVDVSNSMKALDFSQGRSLVSRLDATKYLVETFADKRKSDRLGLIEFAGESFVASPLTLDHSVFMNFLRNLNSNDIGKQGTNLAEALNISIGRLEIQSEQERGKAIILFSDGDETMSSDVKQMAKIASDKGIKIFTVGVGSEDGMPIPDGQDAFGQIIYKKWKGKTVYTALNPDPLKQISKITGGEYFHAENIDDLNNLVKELDKLPKKILSEDNLSPKSEQYFWFAGSGLLLLVFGFILPIYKIN